MGRGACSFAPNGHVFCTLLAGAFSSDSESSAARTVFFSTGAVRFQCVALHATETRSDPHFGG